MHKYVPGRSLSNALIDLVLSSLQRRTYLVWRNRALFMTRRLHTICDHNGRSKKRSDHVDTERVRIGIDITATPLGPWKH